MATLAADEGGTAQVRYIVSWPSRRGDGDEAGYQTDETNSEQEALEWARDRSEASGRATVWNEAGHVVATYVNGVPQQLDDLT